MISTLDDNEHKNLAHESLNAMTMYSISSNCRTQLLLQYFGEKTQACNNCDNCKNPDHQESTEASNDANNIVQCVEDQQKSDTQSISVDFSWVKTQRNNTKQI